MELKKQRCTMPWTTRRVIYGSPWRKAVTEAVGSLMFLGRVLLDMHNWRDADKIHTQAMDISREVLGDQADLTKQCVQAGAYIRPLFGLNLSR